MKRIPVVSEIKVARPGTILREKLAEIEFLKPPEMQCVNCWLVGK